MKTEIEAAVILLTKQLKDNTQPSNALHISQSILNLTHALGTLDAMNK